MRSLLINAAKIFTVPAGIVLESFISAFMGVSMLVYGSIGESHRDMAGAIAAPLLLISTLALVWVWRVDQEWWEAICRPFVRDQKMKANERREREEAEKRMRAQKALDDAAAEAEGKRRIRLYELTRTDRADLDR